MKIQHGQRRAVVCWGLLLACVLGCAGPSHKQYDQMLYEINRNQKVCGVARGEWTLALAVDSWRTKKQAYQYFLDGIKARARLETKLKACNIPFEVRLTEALQKSCSLSDNAIQNNPGVSTVVLLLDRLFSDPQYAPDCEQAPTKKVTVWISAKSVLETMVSREGNDLVFHVNAGNFLLGEKKDNDFSIALSRLRTLWLQQNAPENPVTGGGVAP